MEKDDLKEIQDFYDAEFSKLDKLWDSLKPYKEIEFLYHYTDLNALVSILNKGAFFVSASEYLNDRMEINHIKNIIDDVLRKEPHTIYDHDNKDYVKYFNEFLDNAFNQFKSKIGSQTYILSFSVSDNSLSLWHGYANNDGYRIKLNHKKVSKYISKNLVKLYPLNTNRKKLIKTSLMSYPVIYDYKTQYNFVKEYLKIFSKIVNIFGTCRFTYPSEKELNDYNMTQVFWDLFHFACISKDYCFSYEEEYRIILSFPEGTIDIGSYEHYRVSHGTIIPYIVLDFNIDRGHLPLEEIQIGPKINIDIAKKGLERFLKNTKYKNIIITKSPIPVRY